MRRTRVSRFQWAWAAVLAGGVAVVVVVGNPTQGQSRASLSSWLQVAAVLGPVLAVCVLVARRRPGPVAAVLLAVVSGSLWGLFAVLTKGVVERLTDGPLALLQTPELYAWVLTAIAGTSWQQSAFRAGAITASLPTMTVTEPVVGSALGLAILGEQLRPGEAGSATLIMAAVALAAATVALARGEAEAQPDPLPGEGAAVGGTGSTREPPRDGP